MELKSVGSSHFPSFWKKKEQEILMSLSYNLQIFFLSESLVLPIFSVIRGCKHIQIIYLIVTTFPKDINLIVNRLFLCVAICPMYGQDKND